MSADNPAPLRDCATARGFVIPTSDSPRRLTATHFVAAIGIGIVEVIFLALTYAETPLHGGQLVDAAGLIAAMAMTVALDHAGHRLGAWSLLAIAYVFLAMMGVHHPSPRELIIGQIMAHCLVLAVSVADRSTSLGSEGRRAYIVAAVGGIAAGALIWAAVLKFGPSLFTDQTWEVEAAGRYFVVLHPVYVAMLWLLFAGAGVLLYGERRLAARTLQKLRDAELERVKRSREMIESHLQATQARIEPQFLFNTLAHVRRCLHDDRILAERMLDELVSFLRAAMPRLRDTSSPLQQEADLARAYLDIVRMQLGKRLDFEIDLSSQAAQARLPSMLLLPLIDCVVTHPGEIKLRVAATVQNGRLTIRVINTDKLAGDMADTSAFEVLRERVATVYGDRGNLGIATNAARGTEALLEIPYERIT